MTPEQRKLTDRQAEVLAWIKANSRLYSPTVREIAAGLSMRSPNGVMYHLKELEQLGYIRRQPRSSRGIEVIA